MHTVLVVQWHRDGHKNLNLNAPDGATVPFKFAAADMAEPWDS